MRALGLLVLVGLVFGPLPWRLLLLRLLPGLASTAVLTSFCSTGSFFCSLRLATTLATAPLPLIRRSRAILGAHTPIILYGLRVGRIEMVLGVADRTR